MWSLILVPKMISFGIDSDVETSTSVAQVTCLLSLPTSSPHTLACARAIRVLFYPQLLTFEPMVIVDSLRDRREGRIEVSEKKKQRERMKRTSEKKTEREREKRTKVCLTY